MGMKSRTNTDWSKHELRIIKNDNVLIHGLKKPGSGHMRVRFINTK